jgi:hypothetical protein
MRACVLRGCRVARFFPADAVVIASIDRAWAVDALRPAALVVDDGGEEGTNVMTVDVVVVVVEFPDSCSAAFLLLGFWVGCHDAGDGGSGPGRRAPALWPRWGRKVVLVLVAVVGTTGTGGRGAMAAKALRGASRGRIGRASASFDLSGGGGSIAAACGGGNVVDEG